MPDSKTKKPIKFWVQSFTQMPNYTVPFCKMQ
jgi:hypothetical protein